MQISVEFSSTLQTFHLDDDMVELLESGQVFEIDLNESQELPGKFELTMNEQQMKK